MRWCPNSTWKHEPSGSSLALALVRVVGKDERRELAVVTLVGERQEMEEGGGGNRVWGVSKKVNRV